MVPDDKATLFLADGSEFRGRSVGISGVAVGEVVFNTAMTGYQEILTDPSYAKQIVTLTYSHIGNTGVNDEDFESEKIWAEALVVRNVPNWASNRRMQKSLADALKSHQLVALADIDTRRLTRLIRSKGAQAGCIVAGNVVSDEEALRKAREFPGLSGMDLAKVVSRTETENWKSGGWDASNGYREAPDSTFHVVAYDFGVKRNILRLLVDRGCDVMVVPAKTPASAVLAMNPDGVFLSNGPGDPEPCDYAIEAIREILDAHIPVFGICLGHQLLALASGACTVKMPFGHHGANHPVKELESGRVLITSQNHGFAVDADSLPQCMEATHVSLFDGSLQGVRRTDLPAFGFQGHPEASPGPQDVKELFDHFVHLMNETTQSRNAASN